MASYAYEAESPEGDVRSFHLDDQAGDSDLINALRGTFPEYNFKNSEISGREGNYRVEVVQGGTFTVRKQGRQEAE